MRLLIPGTATMAGVVALLSSPAAAQSAPPAASTDQPDHGSDYGEVVVTAPVRTSERDVLQGISVLSGEHLTRELRPTIGETLARLPGVSATSFGPSASRPVLRGMQGDRVRVLTDGIGAIDVSNTSVDHAVVIDPLLADRVEVLRGPSALLFGSAAVGGVVNVIDRRIPHAIPANGFAVNGIANYGSAANEWSAGATADVALGGGFVLHGDGSYLKAGNLRTGGYILSRDMRAAALSQVGLPQPDDDHDHGHDHGHDHDHDHGHDHDPIDFAANAALRGKLPNSAVETSSYGAGASYIGDRGMLGVSYSRYDSRYGVPARYATEIGQDQHAPRIDVAQNRFDLKAEVEGTGFVDRLRLRVGHAKYRHHELEEDGSIGTSFRSNGTEARFELVQARQGGWQGATGVQYFNRQFDVVGEEAFLPRNETEQVGLFTLQQFTAGALNLEGGLRYERTNLSARPVLGDLRYFRGERDFDAMSGSVGASYGLAEGVRVGLNLSRTSRAPSAEELFANGAHAGTQAYEIGNPDFRLEKSWGLEASLHAHRDGFSFDGSAYYNWFSNYIYQGQVPTSVCETAAAPSDRHVELPCFQYSQADARYWGFEADVSARLARVGGWTINADLLGDYVRARVKGGGPIPRIPPLRLLGGIEAQSDTATGRVEVERLFKQDRIAAFETPTKAYTLVNASLSLKPWGKDNRTSLLLSANNIFDVNARRHASVLKDFAPLAGRDLRATIRLGF